MSYYPTANLASLADTMHMDARILSLFYPGFEAPAAAVQDTSSTLEGDLKALILQARRIDLLNKCLAECDALLASPRSSTPQSLLSYSPSSSSSDSESLLAIDDSGECPWDTTMSTLASSQGVSDSVKLIPGSIAQHQPPARYSDPDSDDASEESFFDTHWITHDGLLPPDLLEQARLGARSVDGLVPLRPYALSAAGWSQLDALYMEAASRSKAAAHRDTDSGQFTSEAESNIAFARAAQMQMKAARMHRIAHQVRVQEASTDSGAASLREPDSGECAASSDGEPGCQASKLYAPMPVRARRLNEPRAVEWLQNVAELHLAYWQQRSTSRGTGAGGPLRARPMREELDNMEYWYRVQYMQDPNWCPVF